MGWGGEVRRWGGGGGRLGGGVGKRAERKIGMRREGRNFWGTNILRTNHRTLPLQMLGELARHAEGIPHTDP